MNIIIFVVYAIFSVAVSIIFFNEINNKIIKKSAVIFTIFSVIPALADVFKLIDFAEFQGAFVFMSIVNISEWIICMLYKKYKFNFLKFTSKIIIICSILELTVFNMPLYHLVGGEYKQTTLNLSKGIIESGGSLNNDGSVTIEEISEMTIVFENINMPVGTVKTEIVFPDGNTKEVLVNIDVKDETQQQDYRYDIAKSIIIDGREKSQNIECEFSGNVSDMRIRLFPQNSGSVILKNISLNMNIPIDISYVRFLFITCISVFIYTVMKENFMKKSYAENKKFCCISAVIITYFCSVAAFLILDYKIGSAWESELKTTIGNQMTQELVDAFENGQVSLTEKPLEELSLLENPYDTDERDSSEIYYLWDHVYYNNQYYSYYGIAPVILLFLPYHLLTGYYFPESLAVCIFSILGITGLSCLFTSFVKKWFSDISSGIFILSLILIQTVSGIWFSVGRAWFYEIAMSAGFAFLSWSVFFLFESNIIGKGKISLPKTAVASLLSAISVLCRPTLALYCICIAIFMLMALSRVGKDKKFDKQHILYITSAFLPMICLGICQMWYNYARFGSILDFGIQYSLTINDFTKSQYHTKFVLIALFNYLFNFPVFSTEYPFIYTQFQNLGTNGFFYDDYISTANTSGLFFLALPMFAYMFTGKAYKKLPDRQTKVQSLVYIGIPCVLIPLLIISSVWESGYAVRYMVDFSWEFVLGAFAIIFFLYRNIENELAKKIINSLLCFSLVWALLVSGVQSLNQAFRYADYNYNYPEIAYSIEQIFAFWK